MAQWLTELGGGLMHALQNITCITLVIITATNNNKQKHKIRSALETNIAVLAPTPLAPSRPRTRKKISCWVMLSRKF